MPKSEIVSISEDQKIITHASGFVSVIKQRISDWESCSECVYSGSENCINIPCLSFERKDIVANTIFIGSNK